MAVFIFPHRKDSTHHCHSGGALAKMEGRGGGRSIQITAPLR